jgi:hypothetical protein
MILDELQMPVDLESLLKEYFSLSISISDLSKAKITHLLESTNSKISNIRNSDAFHSSQKDPYYMGLLVMEKLLREADEETEDSDEKKPSVVKKVAKKVAYAAPVAASYLAHAGGSALGAFAKGLKGQTIHS